MGNSWQRGASETKPWGSFKWWYAFKEGGRGDKWIRPVIKYVAPSSRKVWRAFEASVSRSVPANNRLECSFFGENRIFLFFFFFLMITVNLNLSWITSWEIELKQWSNRRKHDLKNIFWRYKKIREFVNYLSRKNTTQYVFIILYFIFELYFSFRIYLCSKLVKKNTKKENHLQLDSLLYLTSKINLLLFSLLKVFLASYIYTCIFSKIITTNPRFHS